MPDAIAHLGVLDGDNHPFWAFQDMSIISCSGRKSYVTGFRLDRLPVGVGLEVARVVGVAFFLVADLVTVRIVHFTFHVTPHIDDLPNAATLSKSYSA